MCADTRVCLLCMWRLGEQCIVREDNAARKRSFGCGQKGSSRAVAFDSWTLACYKQVWPVFASSNLTSKLVWSTSDGPYIYYSVLHTYAEKLSGQPLLLRSKLQIYARPYTILICQVFCFEEQET